MNNELRRELDDEKRTEIVSVRMGDGLRNRLNDLARRCGLSASQMLRELALDVVTGAIGRSPGTQQAAAAIGQSRVLHVLFAGKLEIRVRIYCGHCGREERVVNPLPSLMLPPSVEE